MYKVIENAIIILSFVFLIFVVLDYYNAKMNFLGNTTSVVMLIIFCVLSIGNSIYHLVAREKIKK